MNMQAGDKAKKSLAYFKIGSGVTMICLHLWVVKDTLQSIAVTNNTNTNNKKYKPLYFRQLAFSTTSFAITSLLIQSGLRDLKKIKKKENKQKVLA